MPSYRELLAAAKREIREVDTSQADELRTRPGVVLLDVREPDEHEQGAVPGSLFLPRGNLESGIESRVPDKSTPLVVYCAGGNRSAFAAKTLAPTSSPSPAGSTAGRTRDGSGRRPGR
jgi:sulfur-carrier protein adenylyltransferase/sulfurtransferase